MATEGTAEKASVYDLAVLGGPPAFAEKLHVGRPNIGSRQRLMERLADLLERRWLTNNGPYVQEFEERIRDRIGVRHCIAMCNATVALEIAIRALDLQGEVIVPSMTFVATAHALQWQQIQPVFCDIDPHTHNLDPRRVEEAITERTSGIIGVHLWGRPGAPAELERLASGYGLKLLFDAAHAFGCSHGGRMIGDFGDAEVFSFHATKFVNSGEGGAVVTNDDDLATKVRLMKNFGFSGYDNVVHVGTNGKMSEMSAAMGITSLESIAEFVAVNRHNHAGYQEALEGTPGLRLVRYDEKEEANYQYVVLEVDQTLSGIGRDELVDILWAENVMARRYFHPGCHRMEPYRTLCPDARLRLRETEALSERLLSLPTGTAVGDAEISTICQIIKTAVREANVLRREIGDRKPIPSHG